MPFPLTTRAHGLPPSHVHNTNGIVRSQQAQHTAGMPNSFIPPQPPTAQRTTSSPCRKWPGIKRLPYLRRKRYFRGAQDPLSNFHLGKLNVFEKIFKSLEHASVAKSKVFRATQNSRLYHEHFHSQSSQTHC